MIYMLDLEEGYLEQVVAWTINLRYEHHKMGLQAIPFFFFFKHDQYLSSNFQVTFVEIELKMVHTIFYTDQ